MIVGTVNSHREAVVRLVVHGEEVIAKEIEVVIDTGFSGWLSLPPSLIAQLELAYRRRGLATLADGSEILYSIYEGTVEWQETIRRIPIDEAETDPLIGMALLQGYELNIEVTKGGNVSIKQLPQKDPRA